jgi:hypothetical protein
MARKTKNKPTQTQLKSRYAYISAGAFAGQLIPLTIHEADTDNYMRRYSKITVHKTSDKRMLYLLGATHPLANLIWLYHKGTYPDHQVLHKNGDSFDTRIENLYLSTSARECKNESGVAGITLCKSGIHAGKYRVDVITNAWEEVPLEGEKTKGWTSRPTKLISKRVKTHVGYFEAYDLERAKRAHKKTVWELSGAGAQAIIDYKMGELRTLLNSGMYSPRDRIVELLNAKKITLEEANIFDDFFAHRDTNRRIRCVDGKYAVLTVTEVAEFNIREAKRAKAEASAIRIYA